MYAYSFIKAYFECDYNEIGKYKIIVKSKVDKQHSIGEIADGNYIQTWY